MVKKSIAEEIAAVHSSRRRSSREKAETPTRHHLANQLQSPAVVLTSRALCFIFLKASERIFRQCVWSNMYVTAASAKKTKLESPSEKRCISEAESSNVSFKIMDFN